MCPIHTSNSPSVATPASNDRAALRLGEFDIIDRIKTTLGVPSAGVQLGIGDDTAILSAPSTPLLFCSDAMVEGVHFDLRTIDAESLGYKAMMACASDCAAMNGEWLYSTVSLALPRKLHRSPDFIDSFYQGVAHATRKFKASVVGGDLTHSPGGIFIDVSCIGTAAHPVRRQGSRVGDWIVVSGHPGSSKAGFELLNSPLTKVREQFPDLVKAHLRPEARFDLVSPREARTFITSMIDISDGLSSELHHLQAHSGHGFEISEARLPVALKMVQAAASLQLNPDVVLDWVFGGGEDYELLATVDPNEFREPSPRNAGDNSHRGWTVIGQVTADAGVWLTRRDQSRAALAPLGFTHF